MQQTTARSFPDAQAAHPRHTPAEETMAAAAYPNSSHSRSPFLTHGTFAASPGADGAGGAGTAGTASGVLP